MSFAAVMLLAFMVSHTSAMQYGNRRSFIILHGSGTSAGAFINSPTAAGAKDFLTGVPRRPDQGSGKVPLNWQYVAVDAGTAEGNWWEDGDDALKGMDASVAAVEAAIEEEQGAISGIIGHGQGGLVAAIVAARAALGEGPVGTASGKSLSNTALQFAVICGATMPSDGPYAALLHRLRDAGDGVLIQTLHCLSKTDPNRPLLGEELAACFPAAELLWHDRGAAMPDRSWWKLTRAFPDRALGIRRYVDQFSIARTDTPMDFTTPANEHTPP
jgi:hypothetical protein